MTDLREALAELPRDQCEVLVLRHFAGLSPTEIAKRTGRSEGSIHGLHHRGRRALRVQLSWSRRRADDATSVSPWELTIITAGHPKPTRPRTAAGDLSTRLLKIARLRRFSYL